MADPRFFTRAGPFSLAELARITGASLQMAEDPAREISDVAPLATAEAGDLSFLDNRKYISVFEESRAGVCLVHPDLVSHAPSGMAVLVTPAPYKAYALAARAFYPLQAGEAGVASGANVDPSAHVAEGCVIEHGAVIGPEVQIGKNCRIGANAVIGRGVVMGHDCVVGPNACIQYALIGARVYIYPGACIGQDGFGFASDHSGHLRIPQLGRVIIEDDVEIGANSTIDRGAGPDTVICRGAMIDNLVQVAHNVHVGPGCVLVAQSGISGSSRLEAGVIVAGQSGVAGHLTVGRGARVGAKTGVMRDVPAGQTVLGSPALPKGQFMRQVVALARLAAGKTEKEDETK